MARTESDREDLWAEAVGLTARAEFVSQANSEPVVVGFRETGGFSIYFGQDVMLQFTETGGLRRAYRHGNLYRTQGATLAWLRRRRSAEETTLVRIDLSAEELNEFRAEMSQLLTRFQQEFTTGQWTIAREINPRPQPLREAVLQILQQILTTGDWLAPAINRHR